MRPRSTVWRLGQAGTIQSWRCGFLMNFLLGPIRGSGARSHMTWRSLGNVAFPTEVY